MSNTPQPTDGNVARVAVSFAAIDQYIEQNIILPVEKEIKGKDRVMWGTGDKYPEYLNELYNTVPSLGSIIDGTVDFITGDEVTFAPDDVAPRLTMNHAGTTPRDQVRDVAHDLELYGGFAIQVIRSFSGEVVETHHLDMKFVRSNKENTVFYYCEDWQKRGNQVLVYPAFRAFTPEEWTKLLPEERDRHASSVLLVKTVRTQTYPSPVYRAAVKDCEIERNITDYHLNSLENGFASSAIVNFNNGQPDDNQKEEIEDDFNEKFSGHQNAGRILFSWNKNKDSATTIEYPKIEDFGEKYKALSTHSRQQIFASFRAIPALFGIMTESTGFNEQEFEQAFRLYNRTRVRPAQRLICDAYERVYGRKDVLVIKPFSLDGADTNVN